jgi:hypothetical protein
MSALNQKCGELEREVRLEREAHAALEAELAREKKAAAEYRETEEFLVQQVPAGRGSWWVVPGSLAGGVCLVLGGAMNATVAPTLDDLRSLRGVSLCTRVSNGRSWK